MKHVRNMASVNIVSESWRSKKNVRYVIKLSQSGEFIEEFVSLTKAGNSVNSCHSTIKSACDNYPKIHKGYYWLYKEDWISLQKGEHPYGKTSTVR